MSRNTCATQGALIVSELKRRAMTYAAMHALGVSTSPQKRVAEWLYRHPEWKLDKPVNARGLVQWRVIRADRGA